MVRGRPLELMAFTKSIFENLDSITATQEGVAHTMTHSYFSMGLIVLPMLAFCFVASFVAEGLQTGFRFTPKAIEPKLSKLNPISGAKRVFGLKALKTFLVDFLKFLAIGSVVWFTLLIFLDDPIFYAPIPIQHLPQFIYKLFVVMFAILVLLLLIVAIINFMIKKKEHDDDMKMTKQEVKEERKSKEVAPEVKSAQRKKAMELLGGQGAADVSTADVVVTNPTHYAVALRYEKGMDLAPVVVAKGENLLARRIKIIAAQHEVPMVENKPVAQALFAWARLGIRFHTECIRSLLRFLLWFTRPMRIIFIGSRLAGFWRNPLPDSKLCPIFLSDSKDSWDALPEIPIWASWWACLVQFFF